MEQGERLEPAPSGNGEGSLRDEDLERLAALLSPLTNPVRLRLLRFLTTPHYLEEIASHLKLTRQAARKHVDQLLSNGAIKKVTGTRTGGAVTEYLVNPQALFVIQSRFEKLGSLKPQADFEFMTKTIDRSATNGRRPALDGTSLFIMRGMDTGLRHRLADPDGTTWTIGRNLQCDISLQHDPWVSNRHAKIEREGDRFTLFDLRSTNATEHNWALLPRGGRVELQHGDVVGVGRTLLLFWNKMR